MSSAGSNKANANDLEKFSIVLHIIFQTSWGTNTSATTTDSTSKDFSRVIVTTGLVSAASLT